MKMINTLLFALFAVAAGAASSQPQSATTNKPYIAFVNVAGALEKKAFTRGIDEWVPGVMPARMKAIAVDSIDGASMLPVAARDSRLPGDARVTVYFVSNRDYPPFLSSPGRWAIVNVRGIDKDADAKLYERRVQKMLLKGLAFACGFGANSDRGRCVMAIGSFETLKGIDSTSASYSPFVAFPLMDYLSARGLMLGEDETPSADEPTTAK